jgi:hypothetical protein
MVVKLDGRCFHAASAGVVPAARFLSRIPPDLQASGGVAQVVRATVS